MKVGDLVEYIAAPRIAIKTGDIGCVENIVYSGNTKIYHVRTLSNGKLRRFNKHHLKVVQWTHKDQRLDQNPATSLK